MLAAVVQIDGYDPVAAAAVTLRAGSHDDPAVCHLNGQTWWPALAKLPTLRYDLFDGAFGGQIAAPASSLSLAPEPWADFGRYALADARLQLWTGDLGSVWAGWTKRFDGRVSGQPRAKDSAAQIDFAVDDRWLDGSLLTTYAGTTGIEGPAALKGQAKPLALGAPRYVSGKLIDSVNSVFQLSAYGSIHGITAALERLARYGAPIGDYATYSALIAASVPPGRWATCLAYGLARFGAPPTGQISFLVEGDNSGPDGWASKPGELIRRIALLSGGAGKIDDASLDALDAARSYDLSIYIDNQSVARDFVQRIAASVNAVAGVSWLGELFVVPVEIITPTVTLAADGSALPQVASVEQIDLAAPWRKLAIGAERAWTVHALSDIAFTATLIDTGDYAPGTTYREGNIVQNQSSSWIYINPTPTAGNAPPTLPTSSNSYWKVLAKSGVDGTAGVSPVSVSAQPEAVTIAATSGGIPVTGALPVTVLTSAIQGGSSVTISSVSIVSTVACTAVVSGTSVVLSAISAQNGSVTFDVTAAGQTVRKQVSFSRVDAQPRGAYKVKAVSDPSTGAPIFPVTGTADTTMTIATHNAVLEDGRRSGVDFGTFPADTITGLSAGTMYGVFFDFSVSDYVLEAFPATTASAKPAMIFYDFYSTSSGGTQAANPTPPAGWRGPSGRGPTP